MGIQSTAVASGVSRKLLAFVNKQVNESSQTTTITSYQTAGSPRTTTFTAPANGTIEVEYSYIINSIPAANGFLGVALSGASAVAASDLTAISLIAAPISYIARVLISGLVAGGSYTLTPQVRTTTSGSASGIAASNAYSISVFGEA